MMQESSHIPVLPHQSWSMKSTPSDGSTIKKSLNSSQDGSSVRKKSDVMNGLHNERHLNSVSSPLRVENAIKSKSFLGSNQSRVRWTVKNLTKKEDGKPLSNINSWLSSHKFDGKSSVLKSSSSNGNLQSQMTSGFDLAKLYPELSSKLGLIKSVSQDNSVKSPSTLKNSQNAKGGTHISRNCGVSNSEFHDPPHKNASLRAVNSNLFNKSSLLYDKCGGNSNASKTKLVSLNNDKKTLPNKNKEKLDLTKLSEDKLRKLILCQTVNNKVPLSSPTLVKCESKTNKPIPRSKVTTVSLFDVVCDKTFPSSFTYPPASGNLWKPNKISILPKCSPPPLPNHKTLSPLQLRVHNLYQDQYAYKSNLFPLGYESSESDTSDDDIGESNAFPECLLGCTEDNKMEPSFSHNPTILIRPYRQQVLFAKERLQVHENGLKRRWALTRALLEAARSNPNAAASTVSHFVKKLHSVLPPKKKLSKTRSSLLVQRSCVYEGESGSACKQRALPGTRHCMRHITYNVDQQLFSQCAAKRDDNSLCRIPTFHLLPHDFPLCHQHADTSSKPASSESPSKGKRARKKSKTPVLSRYGKRNKKRRRASSVGSASSSSVVPSTSVRPSINSPGVCLGSPHSTSPLTPHTSPTFSTPCSDPAGGADDDDGDESELEDEFEGMVSDLPLEAKDLQDVLNKIPEHEFSQILYSAGLNRVAQSLVFPYNTRGSRTRPPRIVFIIPSSRLLGSLGVVDTLFLKPLWIGKSG